MENHEHIMLPVQEEGDPLASAACRLAYQALNLQS